MELLTFEIIVAYFDSVQQATILCENLFWNTLYNDNKHIVNACQWVWENTYNIK